MKKYLILPILLISGCSFAPTEEQIYRVNRNLPDGCEIHHLGPYGRFRDLILVECSGKKTTTLNGTYQEGKQTNQMSILTVNEQ